MMNQSWRAKARYSSVLGLVARLGALFSVGCSMQSPTSSERVHAVVANGAVFINELHYDNVGTDAGEAIEIAGPAGTDLSQYSLVLYNGTNGAAYGTRSLEGTIPDLGAGYGVLAFSYPANGIQNGSPDGIALARGAELVSFLSYEGTFVAVGGPADGQTSTDIGVSQTTESSLGMTLSLTGSGARYADFSWNAAAPASWGSVNFGQALGASGGDGGGNGDGDDDVDSGLGCGEPARPIGDVQGPDLQSPLVDQAVVIEGVVVTDVQGSGANLGGFFVQSETPDADPLTSEGLFVYDASDGPDVAVGDRVRVAGTVEEYYGLTEIVATTVTVCGTGSLPAPTPVALPYETTADLEAREGMLVQLRALTVTETYDLGRYGEVVLSSQGRLMQPGSDASASAEENARRQIILDDARDQLNFAPVPYLADDGTLRLGDTIDEIVAVMHYGFDRYRLQPLDREQVRFTRDNPRTLAPAPVGGDVRVGSLNVLNYFTTLGDRGAHTEEELGRQRAKLVSAVLAMNVDVLGLMEIENSSSALDDFVGSINAVAGDALYARAPEPEFLGTDAIRTALIYKPTRVQALPVSASSSAPVFSRPPLAQAFSYAGNHFSVVVNHFKSKGSCPESVSDLNAEWGQGCWNALRVEQAQALLDFIEHLQGVTADADVVVLGDLNSYLNEDPIVSLQAGGLVNHMLSIPRAERYSYVFAGEAGVLDYGMTTAPLLVTGATIWHINADEPRILDYNQEFNPPASYQPNAYRSSDHDPVILGLALPAQLEQACQDWLQRFRALAAAADLDPKVQMKLEVKMKIATEALRLRRGRLHLIDVTARRLARLQLHQVHALVENVTDRGRLPQGPANDLLASIELILGKLS